MAIKLTFDDLTQRIDDANPQVEVEFPGGVAVFVNPRLQEEEWRKEFKRRYDSLWGEDVPASEDMGEDDVRERSEEVVDLLRFIADDKAVFEELAELVAGTGDAMASQYWSELIIAWFKGTLAGEA